MRFLVMTLTLLALLAAGSSSAFAQKTKTKPTSDTPQTQQQQSGLDPNDPDDLTEIVEEADAAYFVPEGEEPDLEYAFEMYSLAAGAGDSYSMNQIGRASCRERV